MGMISNRLNPMKNVAQSIQDQVRLAGGIAEFVRKNPLLCHAVEIAFPAAVPIIEGLKAAGTASALTKPTFEKMSQRFGRDPSLSPEELLRRASRDGERETEMRGAQGAAA